MSVSTEESSEIVQHAFLLSASGLQKSVHGPEGVLTILDAINLQVMQGEALAIVGPSGSGKSTLLALLAGLDDVSSGEIELFGESLTLMDEDARARLRAGRVGFVFQSFHLLSGFTALENISLAAELAGMRDARQQGQQMMSKLGLAARLHHYPEQLSGGEQQRVALGRAFVAKPELLFADEPTGNLDPDTGSSIIELMFSMREEQGVSLVLVTHDHELARRCDRQLVLRDGSVTHS